ncbi:MAG: hypothetical protein NTX25_13930 [Proteobacteria bacterium]|nr:hypothetical protein [Pseudomonadota bacterium]
MVLQPAQTKEIDRLVQALKLQNGPHITCVEGGPSLELIIQNSEGIEQSFPVAMTACEGGEQSPLDEASFQELFAVLKKALPAKP